MRALHITSFKYRSWMKIKVLNCGHCVQFLGGPAGTGMEEMNALSYWWNSKACVLCTRFKHRSWEKIKVAKLRLPWTISWRSRRRRWHGRTTRTVLLMKFEGLCSSLEKGRKFRRSNACKVSSFFNLMLHVRRVIAVWIDTSLFDVKYSDLIG